jgi:hypothetical protein
LGVGTRSHEGLGTGALGGVRSDEDPRWVRPRDYRGAGPRYGSWGGRAQGLAVAHVS